MSEVYNPMYPTASRLKFKGALKKKGYTGMNWKIVSTYEPKQCSRIHLHYHHPTNLHLHLGTPLCQSHCWPIRLLAYAPDCALSDTEGFQRGSREGPDEVRGG
eukprot:3996886-Pyramimonas_sp.AAC.1